MLVFSFFLHVCVCVYLLVCLYSDASLKGDICQMNYNIKWHTVKSVKYIRLQITKQPKTMIIFCSAPSTGTFGAPKNRGSPGVSEVPSLGPNRRSSVPGMMIRRLTYRFLAKNKKTPKRSHKIQYMHKRPEFYCIKKNPMKAKKANFHKHHSIWKCELSFTPWCCQNCCTPASSEIL